AWSRATDASFTATMRTEGGASSGWGASTSRDIDEIDDTDATHRATEKALAGRQPQPLEPGTYPVILEPQAVADLLGYLVGTMDARRADEGRSFFTKPGGGNRTGEKIVGENITIRSDPTHPDVPATPFQGDGLPTQRHAWVDRGVLRQLVYDRFWAAKQGVEPTGYPANLIVEGGTGTVDDLVAAADRAILVTRFWYIRFLDPQTLLLTGLTRDGLFWVEDGEVRHGLRNFRFNESPIALLGQVTALSEPVRVGRALVPAVAASGFTFSSESASV
ncbi:MAG: metallopeptidase TldD-related protein, partial [bacterium]